MSGCLLCNKGDEIEISIHDVKISQPDITKARIILRWEPKVKRAINVLSVFYLSVVGAVGYAVVCHQYGEQIFNIVTKLQSL
jgi:hypothetical protein